MVGFFLASCERRIFHDKENTFGYWDTLACLPVVSSTGVFSLVGILGKVYDEFYLLDEKLILTERTKSKVVLVKKNIY